MRGSRPLLVVALLAACRAAPEPLPPERLALSELAANVRSVAETDALDIGEPAARQHLWRGWGPDEHAGATSFVWGGGERSLLSFDVVEPRRRRLRLDGWAFPFGDDPPQEVTFVLNGRDIGRRLLDPGPGTVELDIDGDAFRAGENFLELRYLRHDEAADSSPWAAAWDRLRLDGGREVEPPRLDEASGDWLLPARSALEWALELPRGSWLAWDGVVSQGGARLELAVAGEEGEQVRRFGSGPGRMRLTDGGAPRRLVGWTMRAVGGSGALRLQGARLHLGEPGAADPERAAGGIAPLRDGSPPNLLVYLIDTLRADHLGCYGWPRPTSPAIDRLAAEGVRWREARAQAPWTRPAIASILTGLEPPAHAVQDVQDRLPAGLPLLPELLRAGGYQTAMITTNGNVSARYGFDRGWDSFRHLHERPATATIHVSSREVNRAAFDWLAQRDRARPFFLLVHTADPHDPYTPGRRFRTRLAAGAGDPDAGSRERIAELSRLPPAEQARRVDELSQLYDAEIAANDASFGALLDHLDRIGVGDDTAVLLLSDHGEELFDHEGWTHGRTLYEEQLRIPLLLRLPHRALAGRVAAAPAQQIDVLPTLAALAGVPVPPGLPGRDLLHPFDDAAMRPAFAWLHRQGLELATVMESEWKLIRNDSWRPPLGAPPYELYALSSDGGERRDLARSLRLRRLLLAGRLRAEQAATSPAGPAERAAADAELERSLRALGYL